MKTSSAFQLIAGSFAGALAVAGGAFGAHALQDGLSPDRFDTYQTAMSYMLVHAILLVSMSTLTLNTQTRMLGLAGILVFAGLCVFSGSLTILVLLDFPALGAITPIGGILLIGGWVCLGIAGIRHWRAAAD
ncbi:MAG: DUF423 domain-containing protein [Rhodothermales bacterium]|nr:DUF423 domain-containing protein [Rhodothermales bacterium]